MILNMTKPANVCFNERVIYSFRNEVIDGPYEWATESLTHSISSKTWIFLPQYASIHFCELLCVSHTLTSTVQASSGRLARHKYIITLTLIAFSHETMCLHATECAWDRRLCLRRWKIVAIKRSARYRQDARLTGQSLIRAVMWKIIRFWSLAGQSVHL